jgi:multiple sugar transport system permease protein
MRRTPATIMPGAAGVVVGIVVALYGALAVDFPDAWLLIVFGVALILGGIVGLSGYGRERGLTPGTLVGAVAIIGFTMLPVLWVASLSFKNGAPDIASQQFLPKDWTFTNYKTAFKFPLFQHALINSFGISLISTVISVVLATFAAYAIARLDFKGKRLVLSVALAIAMFPVVALVGPLFDLWRNIGLYDTWPGLIIPYMSFTLPLSIWVLSAFFREIPWEMEQAAQVDGATSWQAFRKVIVPLAAPGVFTAAILTFFFAWNDFVFGISLASTQSALPVPASLAFFSGASQFDQPTAAISAAALVVTIPIIILVLLFQRKIVAGLTSGAVKG